MICSVGYPIELSSETHRTCHEICYTLKFKVSCLKQSFYSSLYLIPGICTTTFMEICTITFMSNIDINAPLLAITKYHCKYNKGRV